METQTQKPSPEEEFIPIKGYEGIYEISRNGNVKSLCRKIKRKGFSASIKEKILKNNTDSHGYLFVFLWKESVSKNVKIHRIVASHFIPNADNKRDVNHINGIKSDNRADNLEWCTHKENIQHARDSGLIATAIRKGLSVYCTETGKEWSSVNSCAKDIGISKMMLLAYLHRKHPNKTTIRFKQAHNGR